MSFLHHRLRRHHKLQGENLPYGVRIIAWTRAIRWFGWGLGEALIPIFIFSFSNSFAEAGLFRSTVEIMGLLTLPIIGVWVDRVSAKHLILISLLLYPLVGVSYFFAGLFGMAIFIVFARGLNGFLWQLENVGIATYYRRMADSLNVGASFGYIDTWSTFVWILAALIGIIFIKLQTPIHWLLLAIAPFALFAYFTALRAPKDKVGNGHENPKKTSFISSYGSTMREWRTWDNHLWLLGALTFFSGIVGALMWFFIPIDAFIEGANLPMVVLLAIIGALPCLFGHRLGKLADTKNKYVLITIGLVAVAVITLGLAVFPNYVFKLIASFILGIILELFYVAQSSLITSLGSPDTYGQRGSAFESIGTLGDLVAPLLLGIGLDILGFTGIAYVITGVAIVLAVGYRIIRK